METNPQKPLSTKAPLTKPLDAMRPLVSVGDILTFQQFYRAVERVDKERTPATKDVRRICDEMMKVMLACGVIQRTDMTTHPLILCGMAQMIHIFADAMPFGDTVAMRDIELFKDALGMILDATCYIAMGHAQMMAQAIKEKETPGLIVQ